MEATAAKERHDDAKAKQRAHADYASTRGFPPLIALMDASEEEQEACKYVRREKLGEGGFGTTFRVTKRNADGFFNTSGPSGPFAEKPEDTFAAKVVILSDHQGERSRQLSEAALLSSCHSSFVLGHVEHCVVDDGKVLVMITEFCDCSDLQVHLARQLVESEGDDSRLKGWPEEYVAYVLVQLSVALNYLHHTKNMLHRDIKPRNIFLTTMQLIKLGDFGFSKELKLQHTTPSGSGSGNQRLTGGGGAGASSRGSSPSSSMKPLPLPSSSVEDTLHTLCGTPGFCAPEMYATTTTATTTQQQQATPPEALDLQVEDEAVDQKGGGANPKTSPAKKKSPAGSGGAGGALGRYGLKADMWALGISIYKLVNPREFGLGAMIEKAKNGSWERTYSGEYSDDLWKIILSLLAVDPAERPNTIQLLGMPYIRTKMDAFLLALQSTPGVSRTVQLKVQEELAAAKAIGLAGMMEGGSQPASALSTTDSNSQAVVAQQEDLDANRSLQDINGNDGNNAGNNLFLATNPQCAVKYQCEAEDGSQMIRPQTLQFNAASGLVVADGPDAPRQITFQWHEISHVLGMFAPATQTLQEAHVLCIEVMEEEVISVWYHYHMSSSEQVQQWVTLCAPFVRAAFQQQQQLATY